MSLQLKSISHIKSKFPPLTCSYTRSTLVSNVYNSTRQGKDCKNSFGAVKLLIPDQEEPQDEEIEEESDHLYLYRLSFESL
jgi:hypothetical protein